MDTPNHILWAEMRVAMLVLWYEWKDHDKQRYSRKTRVTRALARFDAARDHIVAMLDTEGLL